MQAPGPTGRLLAKQLVWRVACFDYVVRACAVCGVVLAGDDGVPYGEEYTPFPKERIDDIIALCTRLRGDMLAEAQRSWIALGRPQ